MPKKTALKPQSKAKPQKAAKVEKIEEPAADAAHETSVTEETRGRKTKYDTLPEKIICIGCGKEKIRDEFSSSTKMRGTGTSSYCKSCQVDINTLYRYRNLAASEPEKLQELKEDMEKRIRLIDEAFASPRLLEPRKKKRTSTKKEPAVS